MLVSHDRALLRSVCEEFWMVGRGKVAPFDGDLDEYQRYLLDEAKRQRELATVEARIAAISVEKAPLEERLQKNPPASEIAELGRKLKAPGDEAAALDERWLELSSRIEELSAF